MTDRFPFLLGGLLFGLAALDVLVLHSGVTFFLLRKLADFVEYLSFWR
jgi:hypothetical protein